MWFSCLHIRITVKIIRIKQLIYSDINRPIWSFMGDNNTLGSISHNVAGCRHSDRFVAKRTTVIDGP